jgi:hypothetical protein
MRRLSDEAIFSFASMTDENWNVRMREHLISYAPEQNRGNPAPPVRDHDEQERSEILVQVVRPKRLHGHRV